MSTASTIWYFGVLVNRVLPVFRNVGSSKQPWGHFALSGSASGCCHLSYLSAVMCKKEHKNRWQIPQLHDCWFQVGNCKTHLTQPHPPPPTSPTSPNLTHLTQQPCSNSLFYKTEVSPQVLKSLFALFEHVLVRCCKQQVLSASATNIQFFVWVNLNFDQAQKCNPPTILLRPLLLLQVYAKTFSVESKERSCQDWWSWVHKHGFICFNVSVDNSRHWSNRIVETSTVASFGCRRQRESCAGGDSRILCAVLPVLRPRRSRLILTRCSPGLRPCAGDLTESMRQETRKGYEGIKYVHLIFISYSFIMFHRYLMEVIGNWWGSCSTFCSTLPNSMALDFVRWGIHRWLCWYEHQWGRRGRRVCCPATDASEQCARQWDNKVVGTVVTVLNATLSKLWMIIYNK